MYLSTKYRISILVLIALYSFEKLSFDETREQVEHGEPNGLRKEGLIS